MEPSTILYVILTVILGALVAIWRELRITNHATRARRSIDRVILPLSTGVTVKSSHSAQIEARPNEAFKPDRLFVSAAGTSGGAANWVINDIKIGGKSIFLQHGDIPGDMFATNAVDGFVSFRAAEPGQTVLVIVTYIGSNESGVPFFASMVGPSVKKRAPRQRRRAKALVEAAAI